MLIMFDQNDSPAFAYEETAASGWDIQSPETTQKGQVDVEMHINVIYFLHKLSHS